MRRLPAPGPAERNRASSSGAYLPGGSAIREGHQADYGGRRVPVTCDRPTISTGCARRSLVEKLKDAGSIPATSTTFLLQKPRSEPCTVWAGHRRDTKKTQGFASGRAETSAGGACRPATTGSTSSPLAPQSEDAQPGQRLALTTPASRRAQHLATTVRGDAPVSRSGRRRFPHWRWRGRPRMASSESGKASARARISWVVSGLNQADHQAIGSRVVLARARDHLLGLGVGEGALVAERRPVGAGRP